VSADVARATARPLLAERVDPLAAEVRSHWKRVFGDRGTLQLGADGRLTLRRRLEDIAFEYSSSSEKMVAAERATMPHCVRRATMPRYGAAASRLQQEARRLLAAERSRGLIAMQSPSGLVGLSTS
jgi:hypothetical protein